MWDDDFDGSKTGIDAEAFANTLYDIGTSQIYNLLQLRARTCPDLADRDFFPLVEVVLKPYEEFLSPEQLEELWGMLYCILREMRAENAPSVTYKQCEEQVRQHLLGPRKATPKPKRSSRAKKDRRR
jgi:hypothetical protein